MDPIKIGWLGAALDGPGGGYDCEGLFEPWE
jgi:hypothetical protein